jgi:hypothetical protein
MFQLSIRIFACDSIVVLFTILKIEVVVTNTVQYTHNTIKYNYRQYKIKLQFKTVLCQNIYISIFGEQESKDNR